MLKNQEYLFNRPAGHKQKEILVDSLIQHLKNKHASLATRLPRDTDTKWVASKDGIANPAHHYFIDGDRITEGKGAPGLFDNFADWETHLQEKTWFTTTTHASFIQAWLKFKYDVTV